MSINVLEFIEKSAAEFPQKTAVREGERSLTFAELLLLSRITGTSLLKSGAEKTPVGVYMEKSTEALPAFFGAAYAGCCYCMLNAELPDNRLQQIQSVLRAKYIITLRSLSEKAKGLFPDACILTAEELSDGTADEDALLRVRSTMIDTDPLYINFTSGSTGVPKGIAVAHRSVIDFIGYFTDIFGIDKNDIIANQAPFDFDVSVKDIYSAMAVGATLVIVPRALFSAPVPLIDYLCDNRVTVMIWAVSALCLISTFHGLDYKTPDTVKKILFSGEVMPYKHLCEWRKHLPDAMYVNLYGPTEITCNCTYHILSKDRDYSDGIPIGRPFPNEDVFLLDDAHKAITVPGKTGMITVRGTALALGYYGCPEKTAENFIQNPLQSFYPETVYLTGDLGRLEPDGELFYCGRADNQIKYLGHRVELEEIERAMAAIDGVERCICVFDEKKQRLKGYYVGTIEKNVLHSTLRETLPAFMVPGFLQQVETMILSKNGKIDRKKTIEQIGGKKT